VALSLSRRLLDFPLLGLWAWLGGIQCCLFAVFLHALFDDAVRDRKYAFHKIGETVVLV
jgi:hypothetical protein